MRTRIARVDFILRRPMSEGSLAGHVRKVIHEDASFTLNLQSID